MDVVGDVRSPSVVNMLHHQPRLLLSEHEPVAVVVVSRVLVVQVGRNRTLEVSPQRCAVPVLHPHQPIRIQAGNQKQKHVVQNRHHPVIGRGREQMSKLQRHLAAAHLRGVDAARDRHHRARFPRVSKRVGLSDSSRVCQRLLYLAQPVQPLQVARRADNAQDERVVLRRASYLAHPDAVALSVEQIEILHHLRPARELALLSYREPEQLFRCGNILHWQKSAPAHRGLSDVSNREPNMNPSHRPPLPLWETQPSTPLPLWETQP